METLKTTVEIEGKVTQVRMPSMSRPGVVHKVVLSCTCEGFTFNGYCHHLTEAVIVAREDARYLRARTRIRVGR
jgi:hypothetical protein